MREAIEELFAQRLSDSVDKLDFYRQKFLSDRYFKIPDFLGGALLQEMRDVWSLAKPDSLRKDIIISDKIESERHMRTASALIIEQHTDAIDHIYRNPKFISFLSEIACDQICPLDDIIEKYVVNALECEGDLHGAHVDSFPYSCTFLLYAPNLKGSAQLKISKTFEEFKAGKGQEIGLEAGDLFFFCSSELIHQVTAMQTLSGERVALNLAYARPSDRAVLSYSRDVLYS